VQEKLREFRVFSLSSLEGFSEPVTQNPELWARNPQPGTRSAAETTPEAWPELWTRNPEP
jgi:hypothetical protein